MSLGKQIFKIGFLTAVSRVFGFIRDLLIARVLGAGRLSDIFLAAFKLPNLFRDLLGEGAMSSVFVPMFAESKHDKNFAKNAFSWLMLILLLITIIGQILMPFIVWGLAPGFADDPGKMDMTVIISRIMFFYLIFICGSAFLSAVLNAFSKFALVAAMPVLMNIFMIGGLLVAAKHSSLALYIMAFMVVLSGVVQMWILASRLRHGHFGLRLIRPRWNPQMKTMLKRMGINILGSGFYQVNIIVGALVASFQSGAVSWLYYTDRIIQLPFAIVGLAAGTVLLTSVAEALCRNDKKCAWDHQNSAMRQSLMFTVPCVAGLFALAHPIIKYLFEYGAWNPESTSAVAIAIMIQVWVLPAMVTSQIYSKTLYAAQDVKTPVVSSAIAIGISTAIYIGVFPFIGYLAVPIGTVFSGYIKNYLLRRACKKQNLFKIESRTIKTTTMFWILAGALGVGLWFVPVGGIFTLGAAIAGFGVIYLPTAWLINKKVK